MSDRTIYHIDIPDTVKIFCHKHNYDITHPIVTEIYNHVLSLVDQHIFNDDADAISKKLDYISQTIGVNFLTNEDRLDFILVLAGLLKLLTEFVVTQGLVSVLRYASYVVNDSVIIELE